MTAATRSGPSASALTRQSARGRCARARAAPRRIPRSCPPGGGGSGQASLAQLHPRSREQAPYAARERSHGSCERACEAIAAQPRSTLTGRDSRTRTRRRSKRSARRAKSARSLRCPCRPRCPRGGPRAGAPRPRRSGRRFALDREQRRCHELARLLPGRPCARRLERVAAQEVEQLAVVREQVELARRAERVVPLREQAVPAMLDVLVMTGHGCHDAGRPAVKAFERRPEHPLDARELQHHVAACVEVRHLSVAERPDDFIGGHSPSASRSPVRP